MGIFNIGSLELILILLLALIILGPVGMINSARNVSKWIYRMVRSPLWSSILDTSREIRELPQKLIEETGIDDSIREIEQTSKLINQNLRDIKEEAGGPVQIKLETEQDDDYA